MKSNLISKLSLTLILLSMSFSPTLYGIAKYKAMPLQRIHNTISTTNDHTISFAYKKFNAADCREYLGRSKIIRKGYQPIQIHITNHSHESFEFSPENFSFTCIPHVAIADHVNFSTTNRLIGWGIGTLLFFPLVIPFILEAIECPRAHDNLEYDFSKKTLEHQIIKPKTSINGIIFTARKQFNPNFSFTLTNPKNNEKITLSTSIPQLKLA